MKNNQINLFTKPSTNIDDLSNLYLKIKLLHRIQDTKLNMTHPTYQKLYNNLQESISLDHDPLNAQDAEPSFHKKSHDNHDPPNDRDGGEKKETKKGYFDQNVNHLLGPSTVVVAKKLKALIHKDELTIADLEVVLSEAKWNSDEGDVLKPRLFKRHMSKNTKPHHSFYNNDFYYVVSLSTKEKYTKSLTKHYAARYYIQDSRINFFKSEMSNRSERKVYSDLGIKLVVRIMVNNKWGYGSLKSIVVRRSNDNEYEFSYANLPRLSLNDVED
ncbi:hypothetical protein Tco_1037807 [Tanacetum coccineum]